MSHHQRVIRVFEAGVIAMVALLGFAICASPASAAEASAAVVAQVAGGPVTVDDQKFVSDLRLAALWQVPAGKMAVSKGTTPEIRNKARSLVQLGYRLDALTLTAAGTVDVAVPSQPSERGQGWLDRMSAASGSAFDDLYVQLVRESDGVLLPATSWERVSTENIVLRTLSQKVNGLLLNHMDVLESTALVHYNDLAPAAAPFAGRVIPRTRKTVGGGAAIQLIWVVLAAGAIGGAVAGGRLIRPTTFGGGRGRGPARRVRDDQGLRSFYR